ncbi:dephospho-CoA kinase [Flavobacteriaceae bacterium AU392]|nr:dephospho-CoA kinase [Flavobacteriaceae bacterium]RKM86098.1 dephospho-CoA kinase [Flavobacteriaceae bacterium AU392]
MKIVGLTGGIGSGKTTVAKMFLELGVPIYIADVEAKKLMNTSKIIKRKLIALFGDNAYKDDKLNRQFLANKIFKDKILLEKMNRIVHPKVASHFKKWQAKQNSSYVIKEAAILFENGSFTSCDFVITVIAPIEERIKRVISRDNSSEEKVKSVMENQWADEKKIKLSQFVITNSDILETRKQVFQIHEELLKVN